MGYSKVTDYRTLSNTLKTKIKLQPGDIVFDKICNIDDLSSYVFSIVNELRYNNFVDENIDIRITYGTPNSKYLETLVLSGKVKKYNKYFNRYLKYNKTLTIGSILSMLGVKNNIKYNERIFNIDVALNFVIEIIVYTKTKQNDKVSTISRVFILWS